MKRFLLLTFTALCVSLTMTACAPSAEEQAESLLNEGKLSAAAQEALTITDDSGKSNMLEKIMLKAMDAQNVLDYSTIGLEDMTKFCTDFSSEYVNQLYAQALDFKTSDKQETTFNMPEPDFKDANYIDLIKMGGKVTGIFQSYKEIVNSDMQKQLDESGRDLDQQYRKICTNLTALLSATGVADYIYSTAVLGESIGAKKPSIDLEALQKDVQLFTLDYNKAATTLGDSEIK